MNDKKIYLAGIFLSLVIGYEDYIVFSSYIVLAVFTFLALMTRVQKEIKISAKLEVFNFSSKPKKRILSTSLLLCILIIASWFYGVAVGAFNGVKPENFLRNFFGLLLYLLFPIYLIIKPDSFSVAKIIVAAGFAQLIIALYSFKPDSILEINLSELNSISDVRSSYSTSYTVIFPLLSTSFGLLFFEIRNGFFKNKFVISLIFILSLFSLLVVPASKGFILASMILLLIIIFVWFKSKNIIFIMPVAIVLMFFLTQILYDNFTDLFEVLILSFSLGEGGNAIREEQALALISELSFFGAGLGSSLLSGYKRDDTGYGFELTYLNLLHKLGFFSVPLFMLYIYTFLKSLYWLFRDFKNILPYICLGGCCYMIVGVGNPLLLSSMTVTLHCSILYIITKMKGRYD